MHCRTCKWFQARSINHSYGEGDCRKHSPRSFQVIESTESAYVSHGWPRVDVTEFCGEFEAKEAGALGR